MSALERLAEYFVRFPGIGPRQARRFVYFLLRQSKDERNRLARAIEELDGAVSVCAECSRYFEKKGNTPLCNICADSSRDRSSILIVEKDVDLENIEKNGLFGGTYFVLGGTVPILEKNPAMKVRARLLAELIKKRGDKTKEVILALSASPEGENTGAFIKALLSPFQKHIPFTISTLGKGLSTGVELEYSDSDTILHALKNRSRD